MSKATETTDFASFDFLAHVVNTTRECRLTIRVKDTPDRAYTELADEAEERAYTKAAKELGVSEDRIEVVSI